MAKVNKEILELAGTAVTVTNPEKIYFPKAGITKLELVRYYLAVAEGALRGVARRPMILKRYVNGVEAEPFFQKRAADNRPPWIEIATFTFPSGRSARPRSRRILTTIRSPSTSASATAKRATLAAVPPHRRAPSAMITAGASASAPCVAPRARPSTCRRSR